jgi:hypothetical protein
MEAWKIPSGSATHVLMDGGILSVPPQDTQAFYHTCVNLINSGTKLYVVEQKTELFKFFVDLDYKAQEKLKDEDLLQFCSLIAEEVDGGQCLIARALPRPVKEGIKSGVHIHWPDLIVTRTQALNLRTKIILGLRRYHEFDWDKVVDASVYAGSGLRMLWSHKKPSGDPYLPWRGTGPDGGPFTREFSKEPRTDVMELFAIRTDEDARPQEVLEHTGPLEEYIQQYMLGQRRARVKKVQRHEHDGWFVQTDSKFCERIKDEHKSNHVWFSIWNGRIHQRCFDEDCAEFKGTEHILSPSIVEQLKDVAIVGSPTGSFLMDVFPNVSRQAVCRL